MDRSQAPVGIYAFKALYDHRPNDAKGLVLVKNEIVLGTSAVSTSNGWILCQKPRAPYTMGFVPASYVAIYPSSYAQSYLEPVFQRIGESAGIGRDAVSWLLAKGAKTLPPDARIHTELSQSRSIPSQSIDLSNSERQQLLDSPRTIWRKSVDLMAAGQFPSAILIMKELEIQMFGSAQLMFNIAMAYHRLSQFYSAIYYYTLAIRFDAQMLLAYFSRAVCYQSERDHLQALSDYCTVLEQMDTKSEVPYRLLGLEFTLQKSQVLYNKAVVLAALGRLEQALSCLTQSLLLFQEKHQTAAAPSSTNFESVCLEMQRSLRVMIDRKKARADPLRPSPSNMSPGRTHSPKDAMSSREALLTPTTAIKTLLTQNAGSATAALRMAGATGPRTVPGTSDALLSTAMTSTAITLTSRASSGGSASSTPPDTSTLQGRSSGSGISGAKSRTDIHSFLPRAPTQSSASPSSSPIASPIPVRKAAAQALNPQSSSSPLRWALLQENATQPTVALTPSSSSSGSSIASPSHVAVPKLLLNTINPTTKDTTVSTPPARLSPPLSPPHSPSPPKGKVSPSTKISPSSSPRGAKNTSPGLSSSPRDIPQKKDTPKEKETEGGELSPSPFPFHRMMRESAGAAAGQQLQQSVLAQTLQKIGRPVQRVAQVAAAGVINHSLEAATEAKLIVAAVGSSTSPQNEYSLSAVSSPIDPFASLPPPPLPPVNTESASATSSSSSVAVSAAIGSFVTSSPSLEKSPSFGVINSPTLERQRKKAFAVGTHRPGPSEPTTPFGTPPPSLPPPRPLPQEGHLGLPPPPMAPPPLPPVDESAVAATLSTPSNAMSEKKKTRPTAPLPAVPPTKPKEAPPRAEFLLRSSSRAPLLIDRDNTHFGMIAPPKAKPPPSPATSGPNSRTQSVSEVPSELQLNSSSSPSDGLFARDQLPNRREEPQSSNEAQESNRKADFL